MSKNFSVNPRNGAPPASAYETANKEDTARQRLAQSYTSAGYLEIESLVDLEDLREACAKQRLARGETVRCPRCRKFVKHGRACSACGQVLPNAPPMVTEGFQWQWSGWPSTQRRTR